MNAKILTTIDLKAFSDTLSLLVWETDSHFEQTTYLDGLKSIENRFKGTRNYTEIIGNQELNLNNIHQIKV